MRQSFELLVVTVVYLFDDVEQETPQEKGTVCLGWLTLYLLQKAILSCFVCRSKPVDQQEVV